jgi:hypothetical protein
MNTEYPERMVGCTVIDADENTLGVADRALTKDFF